MDRMPEAFSLQPGRCFRMAQSRQLQATHCRGEPAWKSQWRDILGRWPSDPALRSRFGGAVSAFGVDGRAPIPTESGPSEPPNF